MRADADIQRQDNVVLYSDSCKYEHLNAILPIFSEVIPTKETTVLYNRQ